MTAPVRIALLGAGLSGRLLHAPALERVPDAKLVAVADPNPEALRAVAPLAPGAERFEDAIACFDRMELDACIVATPNTAHAELTSEAFRRGLHVYLEKPMTPDEASADALLEAWRKSGRVGQIGFNYRRTPIHGRARRLVQEGRIGRPVAVRTEFCCAPHPLTAWRKSRNTGGGVLLDLLSHHLDLLEWYFDAPVRWIEGELASRKSEHDTAFIQTGLENGLVAQLFGTLEGVETDRLTIYGDRGALEVDRYGAEFPRRIPATLRRLRSRRWIQATRELFNPARLTRKLLRTPDESSYELALREFVRAIREDRPASPDLNVGHRSLVVLGAAEQAARQRRRIDVPGW